MKMTTANELHVLTTIRAHVAKSNATTGFPTPLVMARWLAREYEKLPQSLRPRDGEQMPVRRFDALSSQEKLDRLHEEMRQADTLNHPEPSVPTPWVSWLLGEFDNQVSGSPQTTAV